MAIKPSSGKQIDALVADLAGNDAVAREAAVARLTVIGRRAVGRLVTLVAADLPPSGRIAALRTLEAIADPRAIDPALDALDDANLAVATAGAATARVFLRGPRGSVAVDRLTEAAVDPRRDARVRLAAIQALRTLDPSTLRPLWKALLDDPQPDVRALAEQGGARKRAPSGDAVADLAQAAERELPDDPAVVRDAVTRAGGAVALGLLHRLIERVREREAAEPSAARRAEWMRARAAAHVALASRGSRLALYDLRETLESADAPLPVEFLAALSIGGDASCLAAIAAAYARSGAPGRDDWWRQHLADAFRAIVAREAITRRHAVMRRIEKRWPDALDELSAGGAGGTGKAGRAAGKIK